MHAFHDMRFMSWPHAQRGLRTLAASEDLTTSISQQHLGFTQRYLSFFFMAMMGSCALWVRLPKFSDIRPIG